MGRLIKFTGATWMAAMIGAATPVAAAAKPDREVVRIVVLDFAGVGTETLSRAKTVTEGLFRQIDVDVLWLDQARYDPRLTTPQGGHGSIINLVLSPEPRVADLPVNVLGLAVGTRVYVWTNRVTQTAAEGRVVQDDLLGHVMAHELGHALLGVNAHTPSGLMAATMNLDRMSLGRLRFDRRQAETIRMTVRRLGGQVQP